MCPTPGAQYGFLSPITYRSRFADYLTLRDGDKVVYRHNSLAPITPPMTPCCRSMKCSAAAGRMQPKCHTLDRMRDQGRLSGELGVLLYGYARNACWYGSRLPIAETCFLALYQNATGIEVSSAVLAAHCQATRKHHLRHRLTAMNWTCPAILPRNPDVPVPVRSRATLPTARP